MNKENMEDGSQVVTSNRYERKKTFWSLLLCGIAAVITTAVMFFTGQLI